MICEGRRPAFVLQKRQYTQSNQGRVSKHASQYVLSRVHVLYKHHQQVPFKGKRRTRDIARVNIRQMIWGENISRPNALKSRQARTL